LNYLRRLLLSIEQQKFKDFEVIITDDSTTHEVKAYIEQTSFPFPIQYHKNNPAKGTPLNWMEGIKFAKGDWIKIMHDDDWFTDPDSLKRFANLTTLDTDCIFSGYYTFYEDRSKLENKTISSGIFKRIKKYPYFLFGDNVIGPPSVLLFRNGMKELYDPQLKWLVDLEAYVRMMKKYRCSYLAETLITMSNNETQVTKECFRNKDIEVKEALIYYHKHGNIVYSRLMAYDAWWRLIRNLNIRTKEDLIDCAKGEIVPLFLFKILEIQQRIPTSILNIGLLSKILMLFSFIKK
jgi:glycosyltransferase involved in cell wall biosynthesis